MLDYACSEIAAVTGGRLVGPDSRITGVSYDSRATRPGELFFALPGGQVDGHRFVDAAFAVGAAAAVVNPARLGTARRAGPVIEVSDPLSALGTLAAWQGANYPRPRLNVNWSRNKSWLRRKRSLRWWKSLLRRSKHGARRDESAKLR